MKSLDLSPDKRALLHDNGALDVFVGDDPWPFRFSGQETEELVKFCKEVPEHFGSLARKEQNE